MSTSPTAVLCFLLLWEYGDLINTYLDCSNTFQAFPDSRAWTQVSHPDNHWAPFQLSDAIKETVLGKYPRFCFLFFIFQTLATPVFFQNYRNFSLRLGGKSRKKVKSEELQTEAGSWCLSPPVKSLTWNAFWWVRRKKRRLYIKVWTSLRASFKLFYSAD